MPDRKLPAGIFPTKYGTFEYRWREGRRQRCKTFKNLKGPGGAEQFKAETERRLAEGKPVVTRKDVPTLHEFVASWLARRTDLAETTMKRYVEQLEVHVLPPLGHLALVDLRPRVLDEWQEQRLAAGAGPAVLGKAQRLLKQILDRAVLPHEYLDTNPVLALDQPKYDKRPHRWLTAVEVESLRTWFLERDDVQSAALISVLAYVGIRPQDALARTWEDLGERLLVDTKNVDGVIVPGSKTGEGYKRTVFVPGPVREDLDRLAEARGRPRRPGSGGEGLRPHLRVPPDLIFTAQNGGPWTASVYSGWRARRKRTKDGKLVKCFRQAAEDQGLGNLTPYALRHTAASLFAAAGWSAVEIAHQLGHSVGISQSTYQHLLDPSNGAPRKSVEEYIEEARGGARVAV